MPDDPQCLSRNEVLSVHALHYRHANQPQLFDDLTLSIFRGERVALLGANGAGKSTLFRLILGLIPASQGDIRWFGNNLQQARRSKTIAPLNQRIAFIPQHHGLSLRLSVLSNVIHGRLSRGHTLRRSYQALAFASERNEATELIRKVGLESKALQPCQELSGGESQRVALARALFVRPEVIIADEPAASLDPSIAIEMMDLLTDETRESQCTILFATHSLAHAFRFSDRLIVLRSGRVVLDSSTNLCTEDEVWKHYG